VVTVSQWRESVYDENLELPFEVSNESTLAAFFSETVLLMYCCFFLGPINALMNVFMRRENHYDENLELPFEVSNESTLAALFSELVL